MADYEDSKPTWGSVFPDRAVAGQEFSRVEPLITPAQLKTRHLFGLFLGSFSPNPITKQRDQMTDPIIADYIDMAVAELELETGLTIFPVQYDEKHPFDRNFWAANGHIKVEHRPVASLERFAFTPATGNDIFIVSNDWVDSGQFHKGQINILPIAASTSAQYITGSTYGPNSSSSYLAVLAGATWIPSLIRVIYTAGFPNAQIPKILNDLIGMQAAINILGMLAATNQSGSYSLSMDGGSQSVSTPGPEVYNSRIQLLDEKKKQVVRKLKNLYGLNIVSSYV